MGHLHMIRQGLQSTKEKHLDTYMEDNSRTNVAFHTMVDTRTMKEGKNLLRPMQTFPQKINQGKQIHLLHIYI